MRNGCTGLRNPLEEAKKSIDEIIIKEGIDIPKMEIAYEKLARKGELKISVLLHSENQPTAVRVTQKFPIIIPEQMK